MEDPGEISDDLYHTALQDVADVLGALSLEWWPCRGTLIALLRHGARSGSLSRGLVDVVERDIDLMIGVSSEADWQPTGRAIEAQLLKKGWDRCWTKSSAKFGSDWQFAARRDLLYCVRTRPAYMMLDVTSYITSEEGYVYVHRLCKPDGASGASGASACHVPRLGPLQGADGSLPKAAIYPLKRCLAKDQAVPCPSRPLETIQAMRHSGLETSCIALPDTKGRQDEASRHLARAGLQAEDLRILKERSAELDRRGFQSMSPYFANCTKSQGRIMSHHVASCRIKSLDVP
ncbi:unnamed protein product [Effrenium voratum]|uniref:Uncharacterized protein n=1 Tax=Effrenium voratum TaxID=2562239 RepID=A0AA36IB13_9DINO|nr:unnamed protein product [Effrenium voratum]